MFFVYDTFHENHLSTDIFRNLIFMNALSVTHAKQPKFGQNISLPFCNPLGDFSQNCNPVVNSSILDQFKYNTSNIPDCEYPSSASSKLKLSKKLLLLAVSTVAAFLLKKS